MHRVERETKGIRPSEPCFQNGARVISLKTLSDLRRKAQTLGPLA